MDKKYSCQTHINYAIDMFIEETKDFPILDMLEESKKLSTKCDYCKEQAEYVVSRK